MEVSFRNHKLESLEFSEEFAPEFPREVVRAYRMRLQAIRAATDERTFYAMKSWHFEKLRGDRHHQYSMRLNQQWRLILEFEGSHPEKVLVLIDIEDYH